MKEADLYENILLISVSDLNSLKDTFVMVFVLLILKTRSFQNISFASAEVLLRGQGNQMDLLTY